LGADIHAYVDFDEVFDETPWLNCYAADIRLGRNYALFTMMASVRDDNGWTGSKREPRGLPAKYSFTVDNANVFYIGRRESGERTISRRVAAEWVKKGHSTYTAKRNRDGRPSCVTDPNWHSHSWLTAKELREIQAEFLAYFGHPYGPLEPLITMMDCVGDRTRLVFWFDN
jgi:hypothetical protein